MSRRYIVAGGRDFSDYERVHEVCNRLVDPYDTIISGCAKGADTLGEQWAQEDYTQDTITLKKMPADWKTHGKSAGVIRNQQMAQEADVLIAFWDGKSFGTKHMIEAATRCGLEVHIYRY